MKVGKLEKLIIHYIGNKGNGDGVKFSNILIEDFSKIEQSIKNIIEKSFSEDEQFHFTYFPKLELNPIYTMVNEIFNNESVFIDQTKNIGRLLYDKSMHPQIKLGELFIFYIKNCNFYDEVSDCVGIIKSENKEKILKIEEDDDGYWLLDMEGLNINKLDKGCLIFNIDRENGYKVCIVDNSSKGGEAQYWKKDFLGVKPIKNEYHQTKQFLGIAKQFVTKHLSEQLDTADRADFMNRSIDYFKNNEVFDKQEFEEHVFGEEEIISSFREFDQNYRKENEIELLDNFEISEQAVKKQTRAFKSILKLDKNFHIYIHGNREMIQKGTDEDGRKYYKIYYEKES